MRSGEWSASQALPSRAILSEEYGVAPGTVSLVFRNLEQEGIVRVLPRKGVLITDQTAPEPMPQSAPLTIGLRGSYVSAGVPPHRGYRGLLVNHLLEAAQEEGISLLILQQRGDEGPLTKARCQALGLSGMIFLGGDVYNEAVGLRLEGFPVMSANRPPGKTPLNYVDCDHVGTLNDVVGRFAKAGHKRMSVLLSRTSVPGVLDQLKPHFISALLSHCIQYNITPYWIVDSMAEGERTEEFIHEVESLLDSAEPPTAFFSWSHSTLDLLEEVLSRRGLRVPQDVSVVTSPFTNRDSASFCFSGYSYSYIDFGRTLLSELLKAIENPFHYVQAELPFRFIDKGSIAEV